MKKLIVLPISLAILIPLIGMTAQSGAPQLGRDNAAAIDVILQRAVQQGVVPGVVAAVVDKDRILYEGAFGLMDVGKQKPMQKDAIFRIASMTKPVTAVAVMMLVEQGKLSLDDPVSKYIPSFKNRAVLVELRPGRSPASTTFTTKKALGEVRIRHLLANTSGLAYTFANDTANRLQQKLDKPSDELPLLYEPGTDWTYGASSKVLGQIVEKVSGMGLEKFFNERIFKPLGLKDTASAVPPEKMNRLPTTHTRKDGKLVETPNPDKVQWSLAGDGGLNSTAADYLAFLQMFLNDGRTRAGTQLLRADTIRMMTTNQIGAVIVKKQVTIDPSWSQSFPIGAGRDKFGFGFQITASNADNPDLRSPGSYSWAGIFNTHFWVDPKRQIAAVILMQVLPFYDDGCIKLYRDFEAAVGRGLR